MRFLLLTALLALALIACSRAPDEQAGTAIAPAVGASVGAATTATDVTLLEGHHWRLHDARSADNKRIDVLLISVERPVQLDFAQGRLSISNTCNRMGGAYSIKGAQLEIGQLMSTMMACADPAVTMLDAEIGARLKGTLSFAIRAADGSQHLTLTNGAGDVLDFIGHPTPAMRFGGPDETIFLEVAGETRPCPHPLAGQPECLQVREVHFDDRGLRSGTPGEFQHFYASIEGFRHEPGVRNVLRVQRYQHEPVPADGSALAYVLDMVVESEQLPP